MASDTGEITEASVLSALSRVVDPSTGRDIIADGLIEGVVVRGRDVTVALIAHPRLGTRAEDLRQRIEAAVTTLPGMGRVSVVLTAQRRAAPPSGNPASRGGLGIGDARLIAVASGKGGVGKSTTAVNLALALASTGSRVGLLDADIYGPSIPRMMGLAGRPPVIDGKLVPPIAFGMPVMSIGLLVEEAAPMIWRGPMVQSAIEQLMRDVAWPALDLVVIDLPPGTGDAQLTLAQKARLAGAVIVSTPQDIALIDARKGLAMFRKVEVPVLGIVENMSYFLCPRCGERSDIFGHGGAEAEAARLGLPFLGAVPLELAIRETSDAGQPIVATRPESPQAAPYHRIAHAVIEALGAVERPPPRIVID